MPDPVLFSRYAELLVPASKIPATRHDRRRERRGGRNIVPVDHRVEHHVELAVVLPPVDGIVGEHEHPAMAVVGIGDVHGECAILYVIRADHQAAEHRCVAADILRQHVRLIGHAHAEHLGTLPELPVPISNNLVTPVLAWWTRVSEVAAVDQRESVDVFRVPVSDLLDPANRAAVEHRRNGRTMRTPAFTVHGVLVWGFTAIVLSRLFDELGWSVPWDHSRIVQP